MPNISANTFLSGLRIVALMAMGFGCLAAKARPQKPVAVPEPTAPIFNPACLVGDWKEQYDNPFVWHFEVKGDLIHIERADHFVSGSFTRTGSSWTGQLIWNDATHDIWNNVILTPKPDCSQVLTNQSWWYHR